MLIIFVDNVEVDFLNLMEDVNQYQILVKIMINKQDFVWVVMVDIFLKMEIVRLFQLFLYQTVRLQTQIILKNVYNALIDFI